MQPAPRDDVSATPIPDALPSSEAPPAIPIDDPSAPDAADGTVDDEADRSDSARPTSPYGIVLGGDATD